ncbi:MAG: cytochrome oxidase assembly [Fibrobacteria bacterium]|jgi:heme A synthase|nr:cytochrome oxidase assembly [Fibrobacteria bacterium]
MFRSLKTYRILAISVLALSVLVILWGAFVRATGSGAGCGSHWPLCNGVMVPRAPTVQTVIEFTHRLTSGLLLVLMAGLVATAFRAFPKGHPARAAAVVSAVFLVIEALVGAGLVLLELVADNPSLARGYWMGGHLANTFILLGCMALGVWFGWEHRAPRLTGPWVWKFAAALFLLLIVGMAGAVAALGNTLFPAETLAEGFRMDAAQESHLLVRLRVLHPLLAAVAAGWLLYLANVLTSDRRKKVRVLAFLLAMLVVEQVLAGFLSLVFLAPIWLQLIHLFLADAVVVTTVLLAAATLTPAAEPSVSGKEAA